MSRLPTIDTWSQYRESLLKYAAWSILGLSLLILLVRGFASSGAGTVRAWDDAYMFCRYAYNLANHGVFGWNPDEPSYGCTSMLYVVWIWIWQEVIGIGISHANVMLVCSSLFFGLLGLFFLGKILAHLLPDDNLGWIWVLPLTGSSAFHWVSLSGMDSTLSFAATCLMVFCWLKEQASPSRQRYFIAIIATYLPFLARPDTGIYFLLFPVLWLWATNQKRRLWPTVAMLGLLFCAHMVATWWYFGDPTPLPAYSKSFSYLEGYLGMDLWPVKTYLGQFLCMGILPFIVLVILGKRGHWKVLAAFWIPMLLTLLVLSSKVQIMGYFSRFFLPSLPFLLVGPLAFLACKDRHFPRPQVPLIILLWTTVMISGTFIDRWERSRTNEKKREASTIQGKTFLHSASNSTTWDQDFNLPIHMLEVLPAGASFAATEHGYPSVHYPDLRIMDLAGLHHPAIAKEGYNDSQLASWKPDLIWMPHRHYIGLRKRMTDGAFFQEKYLYVPNVDSFGVALYLDSPAFDSLMHQLKVWQSRTEQP